MDATTIAFCIVMLFAGISLGLAFYYKGQCDDMYDAWRKTWEGWGDCADCLKDAYDEYEALAGRFHELRVACERAYKVLDEHGLLPEEDD